MEANWRYTCGEKNALLEQKITLWNLEESKTQVPSLFYLCSKVVVKKHDIKKLNLPEEVREKLKMEVWPFNFQVFGVQCLIV